MNQNYKHFVSYVFISHGSDFINEILKNDPLKDCQNGQSSAIDP